MDAVTLNLYNNVCRSLFEKDKLLFSFILATKIMLAYHQIDHSQFMFLLTGGIETTHGLKNPDPDWITAKVWEDVNRLQQLHDFRGFVESFVKNKSAWKK